MSPTKLHGSLTLAVLTLSLAAASRADRHQHHTDAQLTDTISHDLRGKRIEAVTVEVHEGVVTLRGRVRSVGERDAAIEIARRVEDVRNVASELTIERGESDESLGERLSMKIRDDIFYTMFDAVSGSVRDGAVTLTGVVTTPYKSAELAKTVASVPGVTKVQNQMKVLPLSPSDDDLRLRLATAVYGDTPDLASRRNPPIHILVSNGRVTLVGVVLNESQRVRAEHAARAVFGVFSVDDQLKVETS